MTCAAVTRLQALRCRGFEGHSATGGALDAAAGSSPGASKGGYVDIGLGYQWAHLGCSIFRRCAGRDQQNIRRAGLMHGHYFCSAAIKANHRMEQQDGCCTGYSRSRFRLATKFGLPFLHRPVRVLLARRHSDTNRSSNALFKRKEIR